MPTESGIKLQLAMAFGHGAAAMLAQPDALETLLTQQDGIIANALVNWNSSQWPFIHLVRLLGQLSAAHAAADGSAEIRWEDIEESLPTILGLCPCTDPVGSRTRPAR